MMQTPTDGRRYFQRVTLSLAVSVLAMLLAGSSAAAHRVAAGAPAGGPAPAAQPRGPVENPVVASAPLAAPDLALRLESLLGEHSVLAADMMRSRIRGDDDFAQTANAALGGNTDAMTDLIASNFGGQAATRFKSLWAAHVGALFTYASGLADRSASARDGARATLAGFERDLAGFFADASQGRLNRDAAQAAVLMHVDHLLRQADAYAAHDYATADRTYREGYDHTYAMGKVVAAALVAPDQATALDAPVWRLRSELGRLLAEHVVLVVDATRAGVRNSPDFTAAADAVNTNTRDLAAAMASLFGPAAAANFQSLWADHVDHIMAYTAAVVAHDTKGRDSAVATLGTFENRFATFLGSATDNRLDAAGLAKALAMHDQMLLDQTDAYAGKRYGPAHDLAHSTYTQMFDMAGQLADAFGATVAARLPSGHPETGLGGMAGASGRN
jgi:hypothetical protein